MYNYQDDPVSSNERFSVFSSPVCVTMYLCCKEYLYVDHNNFVVNKTIFHSISLVLHYLPLNSCCGAFASRSKNSEKVDGTFLAELSVLFLGETFPLPGLVFRP